jgi:nitrogen regulatory protein PII 2
MMKEIAAVIRPGKWGSTSRELKEAGVYAMTRHRVMGRGKQKGLKGGEGGGVRLLPKWWLILVVEEARVDQVVAALMRANRTGEIGDGKIFVSPVRETLRVRTEETGYPALC